MLCQLCHQRNATVHLRKKMAEQPDREMDLCSVCCPLDKSEKEDQKTINKFFQDMTPNRPDDTA